MATYEDCTTVAEVTARRDRIRESAGVNIDNEMQAQLRLLEISNEILRHEQGYYDIISPESVDSDATIIYNYDPDDEYVSDTASVPYDIAVASQVRFLRLC
jgi:hypothetical protein